MLLCFNTLTAQDRITFTWQGSRGGIPSMSNDLIIRATDGEQFTIDWGDDTSIETKTGLGNTDIALSHEYIDYEWVGEYMVTIAASSTDCKFTYFDCHSEACDDVPGFQITGLTLDGCSDLTYLNCYKNALQLTDLYAAHLVIKDQSAKLFGTQYLPYQPLTGGMTVDFSEQNIIGGVQTFFDVRKGWTQAILNVDYTIDNGIITFIEDGNYLVHMTNGAIISHPHYPAEVVAGVDMFSINIPENAFLNFKIYPNPTSDMVFIETKNGIIPELKLYTLNGRLLQQNKNTEVDLSGYAAGVYLLSVDGQTVKIVKK